MLYQKSSLVKVCVTKEFSLFRSDVHAMTALIWLIAKKYIYITFERLIIRYEYMIFINVYLKYLAVIHKCSIFYVINFYGCENIYVQF